MAGADVGRLLTTITIWFEIVFIPWYLTMIIIMYRSLRDETGKVDQVTFWMIGLLFYGLFDTFAKMIDYSTLRHSPELLKLRIALDLFRAVVVTMFMVHLRFKDLYDEWQNSRRNRNE